MKKTFTVLSVALASTFLLLPSLILHAKSATGSDSISMGPAYANDVYYSMANGTVQTSPRATWDIAFRTLKLSSSILINDGSGVVLYTYPKSDTSGWASVDTSGLWGWKALYNDPADWENGAFMRNATGHPDYGWGIYNMVTHNLTGDSLFVIKLRDGSFRKLRIISKQSAANIYTFRYAMLDGSDERTVSEDLNNVVNTDFSGYSLQTHQRVAFQPDKSSWDILFTKYMSVQQNGTPYVVTGVLSNIDVSSKKFHPVELNYNDFGAGQWDSTRSSIGWDWKVFDMGSFAYKIVDSTVYFVKPANGDIYKLVFTAFAGSATGVVKFDQAKAAGAWIGGPVQPTIETIVYPNPARERINIIIPGVSGEELSLFLTDLTGRQLRADQPVSVADGSTVYSMDVTGVQPGIYFVTASCAAGKSVTKVLITR